jgi:hypothetical protein
MANLAEAKVALAQADAVRAKAAAKVATAQLAVAKVNFANITQSKNYAVGFEKTKAATFKAAYTVYQQTKIALAKATLEQRTAQQMVQQRTTAFEKAQARVNQIRSQTQHAKIEVKKVEKTPVHH